MLGYKCSHESGSSGPNRKFRKNSNYRATKRPLSSIESVLQKCRRKRPKQISRYNLRPRGGREMESRPTIERKTQQGGPGRSRKGRGRNDNPYIEERTGSSNKNARPGGDQQRQDQERQGACTRKSLSLEVLIGNANYKS
ncbi:uncharacterized protein TNCV_3295401 [Trichonephila clavipes]|uniref:Uncharacterized protein n=1 Tax=Trichonephila clavipes TaxID=2585209 RepID=A0A8X6SYY6_TRICX|nr:uncharacterized protein TNCV_3295401 [Trichonephila clavipes]